MNGRIDMTGVPPARRAETTRRIGIVRRYLAIALPTEEDDRRFAHELGLSIDMLLRLAEAWRKHGKASAMPGARGRDPSRDRHDRAAALAAARSEIDLSGVSPARRAETLRRIQSIRRYLTIDDPGPLDLARAAEQLGMTTRHFQAVLRAWTIHRTASALPGAQSPSRRPQRKNRRVGATIDSIITQSIEALGLSTTSVALTREISRRCVEAGLKPPDKVTVYSRLMQARSDAGGQASGSPALAIDHVALNMAVEGPDGHQHPVLSMALALPSGRIVAHALHLSPPGPQVTAEVLAMALVEPIQAQATAPLQINAGFGTSWQSLLDAITDAGVDRRGARAARPASSRILTSIAGLEIGPIKLRPRHTHHPQRPLKHAPGAQAPMTLPEARAAVADAVKTFNDRAGRATASAPPIASKDATARLRRRLKTIANDQMVRTVPKGE